METKEFWHLGHVSDAGLRRGLSELFASGCRIEARLLAHLAEVERRQLFLKDGFSSLYKYCLLHLGLSENAAFHRMTAARIALRYPVVFAMIEQRKIHVSGLCLLRDFLTSQNHRELLEAATRKTKAQIGEELAKRFPREQIADSIRRLPKAQVVPAFAPTPSPAELRSDAQDLETSERSSQRQSLQESARRGDSDQSNQTASLAFEPRMGVDVVDPLTGEVTKVSEPPRAEVRYRVQFDAGSALKAKLELARALSSHANPKGDLAILFERALDLYVEQLQKKRFAKTEKPRAPKASKARAGHDARIAEPIQTRSDLPNEPTFTEAEVADAQRDKRGHIPNATRREVVARDGLRCAYVSAIGHRCDEQAFLQLHHQQAWARQGGEEPDNLRVFCAAHNRFQAEQDFGAAHVARRVAEARAQAKPSHRSPETARSPDAAGHVEPRSG